MDGPVEGHGAKVVYLRPAARRSRLVRLRDAVADALGRSCHLLWRGLLFSLLTVLRLLRVVVCALLVLTEPLLRVTLVPLAFLGFLVTLVFGFVAESPGFPKWGMLAFSVGCLLLYWLYLGLMSLFMRLPRDID